jgi:hypothetical protein
MPTGLVGYSVGSEISCGAHKLIRIYTSGYRKKRKEKKHGILKINGRRGHRVVCWRSPPLKVPNIP